MFVKNLIMKIIKDNEELKSYIKNDVISFDCDIKCDFNINVNASITAGNITAWDITAWNITARNITAWNITAWNITARNITARNITAGDISYYAVCIVYNIFKCLTIKGRRYKSIHTSIDGEIEFTKETKCNLSGKEVQIELDGKKYTATIK